MQRGDQEKLFKNRPKRSPRLKGLKALWRKWHYPLISMHLNCKDGKKFWRKQRLQKCPNGQVVEIFQKIAQKDALPEKAQKHTGANGIFLLLVCAKSAKTGQDFGA